MISAGLTLRRTLKVLVSRCDPFQKILDKKIFRSVAGDPEGCRFPKSWCSAPVVQGYIVKFLSDLKSFFQIFYSIDKVIQSNLAITRVEGGRILRQKTAL